MGENNRGGGLEMIRYNNNRVVRAIGGGCLENLKIIIFLAKHVSFTYLYELLLIHFHMNSGSIECTFVTFSCVYSGIMFTIISFFQKLIKGGLE